jgi:hypothetical protein
VKLEIIPWSDVADLWGEVKPLLEPAVYLTNGSWLITDVLSRLISNDADLWIIRQDGEITGACVAMATSHPSKRIYSLTFIGGVGLRDWLKYEEVIGDWAKVQGCTAMEGCDARGGAWARVLPHWQKAHTIIRRDL